MELRQVRDFGQIISDTLIFVKENFKPLFKAVGIICGFFIVTTMVTNVLMDDTTLSMVSAAKNASYDPQYTNTFLSNYIVRALFLCVSTVFAYVSVYLTTYCYIVLYREKGNQPPSVEEVWAYFKFYFFRVFGSGILLAIIGGCSFMLCGAGIYLMPAFAIFLPVMVIENSSFSYAFSRSFKLINNYWWQTFGVIFVIALIVGFVGIFLLIPGQILVFVQMLVSTKKISLPVTILSGMLKSLIVFTYTVPAVAYCLCYFSLVEVKEGTGLLDRIDMFGKANPDANLAAEEY